MARGKDYRPRRPRLPAFPGHGVFKSVTVERSSGKGEIIVVVNDAPFIYDGTNLEGWVMRIAVALDLSNLEDILTALRRLPPCHPERLRDRCQQDTPKGDSGQGKGYR